MFGGVLTDLLLIVFLLLINAFFAAAEIALVSARRTRLRQLSDDGNRSARLALELAESPARFLSTVQIGITVAGFFASAVGAISLTTALAELLTGLPGPLGGSSAHTLALVLITTLISFFSIVIGELVPKTLAIQAADQIALVVARPIALLAWLARPVVNVLTGTTNLILRLVGSRQQAQFPSISHEELLAMVETGRDEGVIEPGEAAMTEGVFGLRDRRARELMVPRVDLAALPITATVGDVRRHFQLRGHSRIPLFDGDLDHIVGILYIKDLIGVAELGAEERLVGDLARPPLFVPEGVLASSLLRLLQRERRHLAIVVDEHGGTAGLVTLEDLLEEIVGEIADEFDPDAIEPIRQTGPDEVVVVGGLSIADLNDALELDLVEPGVDTISGLIVARLGRFARAGDVIEVEEARLEVVSVHGNRVQQVRVTRRPAAEPPA